MKKCGRCLLKVRESDHTWGGLMWCGSGYACQDVAACQERASKIPPCKCGRGSSYVPHKEKCPFYEEPVSDIDCTHDYN